MSFSIRRAKDSGSVGFVLPTGTVVPFAGSAAPTGWLLCFGQTVSRTTYPDLFATIGTNYGSGDGSTTFTLPDMRGRVLAGKDDMGGTAASRLTSGVSGITATTLGATGGDERVHQHSHSNTASFSGSGSSGTTNINHNHGVGDHRHWISGALKDDINMSYQGTLVQQYGLFSDAGSFSYDDPGYSWGRYSGYPYDPNGTGYNNPAHSHTVSVSGTVTMSNANAGAGNAQNVPPTIIVNYIIKV